MRSAVTVTLPKSTLDALDAFARERGLPRSYAAQELFERVLQTSHPRERRPSLRVVPLQQPGDAGRGL